jgi:uncharacterized protein GlcG (DUF336 family)
VKLELARQLISEARASNARFQIAFGKANGALALGMGSRALMARAEQQPYFIGAVAGAIGGALVPVPDGVLVKSAHGEVIGAIGITGDTSDNDEAGKQPSRSPARVRAAPSVPHRPEQMQPT